MSKKITSRSEDYSTWYNDIIQNADLAENSGVRGCMVIKPYGYAIWENMQKQLDQMFKDTGHQNAYFPLFVPKSLFEAEEKNAEGFAKECAIVTHYRLKNDTENPGKLVVDENAKLEEELIVRPTSEAIIWSTYKKWIQSYRDLPILINQWANVVRWEMRTRLFLRTAEFLWQEGHTAHETKNEAVEEAITMNDVYAEFAQNYMGMPVIKGIKSESERFAGAEETYCIEAMMQDGKALQAGTSHFLGQNFAKAFDVKYANKNGDLDYVWATSWGVSTRLMGALIMTHSDDNGLVLPPKLAPIQVVIIPIYRSEEEFNLVCNYVDPVIKKLKSKGVSVLFDKRDSYKPGYKFNEHEIKGVPIRIVAGPKDIESSTLEIFRRDKMEKETIDFDKVYSKVDFLITDIQENLYKKAQDFTNSSTRKADTFEEFKELINKKGGFVSAHWDGTKESEEKIKRETKATIRLIPIDGVKEKGNCIYSKKPSQQRVLFAKAY